MMSIRACKFCGCTEDRPCYLIEVFPMPGFNHPYLLLPGGHVAAGTETRVIPCAWLLHDVCTNPACVEKAYLEARSLALELSILDELIDVAFPAGIEWETQP